MNYPDVTLTTREGIIPAAAAEREWHVLEGELMAKVRFVLRSLPLQFSLAVSLCDTGSPSQNFNHLIQPLECCSPEEPPAVGLGV